MNSVINFIFAKLPLLSSLNGYKRKLGNWMILIGAFFAGLLAALQYAQIAAPNFGWIAQAIVVVGFIVKTIGDVHYQAKLEGNR